MPELIRLLASIYGQLGLGIWAGWLLGQYASPTWGDVIGKGLFWAGIPLSVLIFVRQVDLSGSVWLAPVIAWCGMGCCLGLAWLWLCLTPSPLPRPSQGSFLLVASIGNTGYLGYPICLAIAGPEQFGWALFYDLLGSLLWGYGVAVAIATEYGRKQSSPWPQQVKETIGQLARTPALWGLGVGLVSRPLAFPEPLEWSLRQVAWWVIGLALVLIGVRLSELDSSRAFTRMGASLVIKMAIVPLLLGGILTLTPLPQEIILVLVLQMAMPPAFATLIVSETYSLDRQLSVSALASGTLLLLGLIPVWLWLFG